MRDTLQRVKSAVRPYLPKTIRDFYFWVQRKRVVKQFEHMPLEKVFDVIYQKGLWSGGTEMLSGYGSYGFLADEYIKYVQAFIQSHGIKSMVDIGCGDFNIGNQLSGLVENYLATDISEEIIRRNKATFKNQNVQFSVLNACDGPVPQADLVTIRQVLQHLKNNEISKILSNVRAANPKYVLITEHCYDLDLAKQINSDMAPHGPYGRANFQSGVVVSEPPFCIPAKLVYHYPVPGAKDQYIYLWLWELAS